MSSDPQAAAFVRKVLEQPDEATTRLVFADWLDETGLPQNAAWARFLRAKAAAATLPPGRERKLLLREAGDAALHISARLVVPAAKLVEHADSLFQLLPAVNLVAKIGEYDIPRAIVELMPESVARENAVLPLRIEGNDLLVATTNPHSYDTIEKLTFILNKDTVAVGCDAHDLQAAINRHYGNTETESVDSIFYDFSYSPQPEPPPPAPDDENSELARCLSVTLAEAVAQRADRVQFVVRDEFLRVRVRNRHGWYDRDVLTARDAIPLAERVVHLCEPKRAFAPSEVFTGRFRFDLRGLVYPIGVTITSGPTIDFDIPDRFEIGSHFDGTD